MTDAAQKVAVAVGQITKWLPPDGEDGALFHVRHDDGDEEDLDEEEAAVAAEDDAERWRSKAEKAERNLADASLNTASTDAADETASMAASIIAGSI